MLLSKKKNIICRYFSFLIINLWVKWSIWVKAASVKTHFWRVKSGTPRRSNDPSYRVSKIEKKNSSYRPTSVKTINVNPHSLLGAGPKLRVFVIRDQSYSPYGFRPNAKYAARCARPHSIIVRVFQRTRLLSFRKDKGRVFSNCALIFHWQFSNVVCWLWKY